MSLIAMILQVLLCVFIVKPETADLSQTNLQQAVSVLRYCLTSIGISIMKIRSCLCNGTCNTWKTFMTVKWVSDHLKKAYRFLLYFDPILLKQLGTETSF